MSLVQRRGPWSQTEDRFLLNLIETHGPLNWVRISQTLVSRTPKQCRERYHQNLKPTLKHDPITPEEGAAIEDMVRQVGKRWADIARHLEGRSDNAVKNWWNGSQNRRKRLERRRASNSTAASSQSDLSMQQRPLPIMSPTLPTPRARYPTSSPSNPRSRMGSWSDSPMLSPRSPGLHDSDSGSEYTTSPANRSRSLASNQPQVQLPPLRGWPEPNPRESHLPRLSLMEPNGRGSFSMDSSRHLILPSPLQLLTAPSSPVELSPGDGREQIHGQGHGHGRTPYNRLLQPIPHSRQPRSSDSSVEKVTTDINNKMRLACLLG
jgi:Myb-like DNA-binding protein FlbD